MDIQKSENVVWHDGIIKRVDREKLNNHRGVCLWFTGLPSSGKSTISRELEYLLHQRNIRTYVLDGDNIRHGLNKNLGFEPEDRSENVRRISEVANLFVDAGIIISTAFISPYLEDRRQARRIIGEGNFIEIYVECDVKVCEQRDPKGLYKRAKAGEIKNFTGISAPYEPPIKAEVVVNTSEVTDAVENAKIVLNYLEEHNYIPASS